MLGFGRLAVPDRAGMRLIGGRFTMVGRMIRECGECLGALHGDTSER